MKQTSVDVSGKGTGDEQVKSLLVNLYFKRREEHWMMAKSVRFNENAARGHQMEVCGRK